MGEGGGYYTFSRGRYGRVCVLAGGWVYGWVLRVCGVCQCGASCVMGMLAMYNTCCELVSVCWAFDKVM